MLFSIAALLSFHVALAENTTSSLEVLMPKVTTEAADTYLCTYVDVPDERVYVTGFQPLASMDRAHHVLMFGCSKPGYVDEDAQPGEQYTWKCGHAMTSDDRQGPPCRGGNLLYAWARNADSLSLPMNTGFLAGSKTSNKKIVLQVHYKDVVKDPDSSGVRLTLTKEPQPKRAGLFVMGSVASVPPNAISYLDINCTAQFDETIYPFAFRTHTHSLGRVVSGYKIDPESKTWTRIGKMDPLLPEMFYQIDNPGMSIQNGDLLAARCTMESHRDHMTSVGQSNNDEMCNFYVMYYINDPKHDKPLPNIYNCWSVSRKPKLTDIFDNVPEDISEFNGKSYVEGPVDVNDILANSAM